MQIFSAQNRKSGSYAKLSPKKRVAGSKFKMDFFEKK